MENKSINTNPRISFLIIILLFNTITKELQIKKHCEVSGCASIATARLSNAADERLDKSDVQVIL